MTERRSGQDKEDVDPKRPHQSKEGERTPDKPRGEGTNKIFSLNPDNEVPQKECLEGQGHAGHSPQGHTRHPPAQTVNERGTQRMPRQWDRPGSNGNTPQRHRRTGRHAR